jgi:Na+-transporting NADH:ubiquinone oxidoreductase subunit C
MSENTRAIVFAGLLSLICCACITTASTMLKKYQLANVLLDRQINIVKSVGLVDENQKYSKEDIDQIYNENIEIAWINPAGEIVFEKPDAKTAAIEVYLNKKDEKLEAYILPVDVRGLWGRIKGYLAIQNDGMTVKGFTVYNHAETPGLGGEIESRWFRDNFVGKKIVNLEDKFVSVSVSKGLAKDIVRPDMLPNYVDGISGATLTGNYLSDGLKDTLAQYEIFSKKLRDGN